MLSLYPPQIGYGFSPGEHQVIGLYRGKMTIRIFDLNIEEVLENWEVEHALREIIANALGRKSQ